MVSNFEKIGDEIGNLTRQFIDDMKHLGVDDNSLHEELFTTYKWDLDDHIGRIYELIKNRRTRPNKNCAKIG